MTSTPDPTRDEARDYGDAPPDDALRIVPNVSRLRFDDVPDEYAIALDAALPGGCMIWSRFRERWTCNPWSTRALVATLLTDRDAEILRPRTALDEREAWREDTARERDAFANQRDDALALVARLAHLERELKCERGEWAPEGWTAKRRGNILRWVRFDERPGEALDVVADHDTERGAHWHWWRRVIDRDGDVIGTLAEGRAPTALAAITEAEGAIGKTGTGS